ncbi:hypothetical protein HWHPT5561_06495 [Petrotoga sp. HWH.PT.55.6.1]|jgi:hypothetical protein|uniref:DUF2922 domain-containing protein n=1 Tax=unclassified Petrotoga TaxID=2620614 RepID=UPI000CA05828|nr:MULTISPECIES: DUF2922 domain-containing protein [unclassified Petrotoga]PNR91803.1 hypothetical protein X926_07790 [Petrotoga sp. HWHPT.55.6.3]RPD35576.1 hypothetical protein HWHPT5561_06495 [Petrotoga sp. HWH.PT.55.6.1]
MRRLRMKFYDSAEGKSKTLSVDGVLETLTQAEIEPVMQSLIGVLVPTTAQVDEAEIVETTTNEVFNLIQ